MLTQVRASSIKEHQKGQKVMRHIKSFKSDLEEVVNHFQDTDVLKKAMEKFYSKYCKGETGLAAIGADPNVKREYYKQQEKLKDRIGELRAIADLNVNSFRNENVHTMATNQDLIRYCTL
jgi:hypothetical protein